MVDQLIDSLHKGDMRALSKCISIVENQLEGCDQILNSLKTNKKVPVIGITGPPGSGKSTLVNSITENLLDNSSNKVAVVAVDPTSPFTHGSLLGDRLRMAGLFTNPSVYIRSLATRGSLGGLSARAFEIIDLIKSAGFDFIIVETVGVGQSEIEIAELADVTLVTLVPESGDEIQAIKAGIVEIADIFVINKSDREGAEKLEKSLLSMIHERPLGKSQTTVLKTIATQGAGVKELISKIQNIASGVHEAPFELMFQRALKLASNHVLSKYDLNDFRNKLSKVSEKEHFNIHKFISKYFSDD